MDVKVINEQMAFNLRHFLINFKSKTYMYEVDPLPNLPKQFTFILDTFWRNLETHGCLFWLRHMKLLKERVQSISEQFLQFCPEIFYLKKTEIITWYMINYQKKKERTTVQNTEDISL